MDINYTQKDIDDLNEKYQRLKQSQYRNSLMLRYLYNYRNFNTLSYRFNDAKISPDIIAILNYIYDSETETVVKANLVDLDRNIFDAILMKNIGES